MISNSELLGFQVYKEFGKGSKDSHKNDLKMWKKERALRQVKMILNSSFGNSKSPK